MSKMKQYIDLMTPMEAYQKGRNDEMEEESEAWCDGYAQGYKKGQEDVCTVSVSDIYEKGYGEGYEAAVKRLKDPEVLAMADEALKEERLAGVKEVVEWLENDSYDTTIHFGEDWQAQVKKWGIKNENCND